MSAERHSNPFGWIFLGFVVGVIATFGAILFLTAGMGGYDEGSDEMRTAADDAAAEAMVTAPLAPVTRKIEAPVATVPPPAVDVPVRQTPQVDSQMADDAAAAGMTSRAAPEQPAY